MVSPLLLIMEETSWITDYFDDIGWKFTDTSEFESFSEISDEGDNVNPVISIDFLLPDDLLERIFAYLPIASIFRAGCVCKRWNEIVNSRRLNVLSQKSWYFMFTNSDEPIGYAYDPILIKWHSLELRALRHLTGLLLLPVDWSTSWTMTVEANYLSVTLSPKTVRGIIGIILF
ncbi:hypothetical protein NE237_002749 [Protea cynaroides]|uniref:F-box domain-containing protein n=1 Tax=Protea cynaroides TaxID=273540 RepID=A0A9Q0KFU4_9MAGN|nr:hypothetical protein NE237_002749 [Protea cynaroides]